MTWHVQPRQTAIDGVPTGRYRLTATSDEDGGGPYGDDSHDHATPQEACDCEACDEFCSQVVGFPSRRQLAEDAEKQEREEYARLKAKYEQDKPDADHIVEGDQMIEQPDTETLEQQISEATAAYDLHGTAAAIQQGMADDVGATAVHMQCFACGKLTEKYPCSLCGFDPMKRETWPAIVKDDSDAGEILATAVESSVAELKKRIESLRNSGLRHMTIVASGEVERLAAAIAAYREAKR